MRDEYEYRDAVGLTRILVVLLSLRVGLGVISTGSSYLQYELLSRADFTTAEAEANDLREQALAVVHLLLNLIIIVFFGIWIVRSNRNVRALGARRLPITPGWAVGFFFVPILNLFKPYQAMRDLVKASRDPFQWRSAPGSPLLPLWWTLWIVTSIVQQISFRLALATGDTPDKEGLKWATQVELLGNLLDIPLCLVAIGLVLLITRAQQAAPANPASPEWPGEHWKDPRSYDDDDYDDDDRITRRSRDIY